MSILLRCWALRFRLFIFAYRNTALLYSKVGSFSVTKLPTLKYKRSSAPADDAKNRYTQRHRLTNEQQTLLALGILILLLPLSLLSCSYKQTISSSSLNFDLTNDVELQSYFKAQQELTDSYFRKESTLERKIIDLIKQSQHEPNKIEQPSFIEGVPYFFRSELGSELDLLYRRIADQNELVLDLNQYTKQDSSHSSLAKLELIRISPKQNKIAFIYRPSSQSKSVLLVRDIRSGSTTFVDQNVHTIEWSDNESLLYYITYSENFRPYQLYKRDLSKPHSDLITEESRSSAQLVIKRNNDSSGLIVTSSAYTWAESKVLLFNDSDKVHPGFSKINFKSETPRYSQLLASAQYIAVIDKQEITIIAKADNKAPNSQAKRTIKLPAKTWLEKAELFKNNLVLIVRRNNKPYIIQLSLSDLSLKEFELAGALEAKFVPQQDFNSENVDFLISSPIDPESKVSLDLKGREIHVASQRDKFTHKGQNQLYSAIGSFTVLKLSSAEYRRSSASADDAKNTYTQRHLALRRRQNLRSLGISLGIPKKNPKLVSIELNSSADAKPQLTLLKSPYDKQVVLLSVYGAYGDRLRLDYSADRNLLLKHGVSSAFCHVRGGGEFGPEWQSQGARENKQSAVDDLLSCARELRQQGYLIALSARSAGAVIAGAAINQHPEYFKLALFDSPTLHPYYAMTRSDSALRESELLEWGDPKDPAQDLALKKIDPTLNLKKVPAAALGQVFTEVSSKVSYPEIYITFSLNDPLISGYEIALYSSRLIELNPSATILLNTHSDSDHSGSWNIAEELRAKARGWLMLINLTS